MQTFGMIGVRSWRDEKKRERCELKSAAAMALNQAKAKQAYPNDHGHCSRSRSPRPEPTPLAPRELFARLVATYVSYRRRYRWAKA